MERPDFLNEIKALLKVKATEGLEIDQHDAKQLMAYINHLEWENQKLREVLGPFIQQDVVDWAQGLIDDDEERYPKSHNPESVKLMDEFGNAGLYAMDFIKARQTVNPVNGEGIAE